LSIGNRGDDVSSSGEELDQGRDVALLEERVLAELTDSPGSEPRVPVEEPAHLERLGVGVREVHVLDDERLLDVRESGVPPDDRDLPRLAPPRVQRRVFRVDEADGRSRVRILS
jgi:hypothetical protein